MKHLSLEELRRLTKEMVDRLTNAECAELLEWAKKEFAQTEGGEC